MNDDTLKTYRETRMYEGCDEYNSFEYINPEVMAQMETLFRRLRRCANNYATPELLKEIDEFLES